MHCAAWPACTPAVDTHNCSGRDELIKNPSSLCATTAPASRPKSANLGAKVNQTSEIADLTKKTNTLLTSNYANAKIEMYNRGPERSEHHASADQDSADHDHRSATIAVDKYATHRSWGDGRNNHSSGCILSRSILVAETLFATDLQHTLTRALLRRPRRSGCRTQKNTPGSPCSRWWGTWGRHRRIRWKWRSRGRRPSPSLHLVGCSQGW